MANVDVKVFEKEIADVRDKIGSVERDVINRISSVDKAATESLTRVIVDNIGPLQNAIKGLDTRIEKIDAALSEKLDQKLNKVTRELSTVIDDRNKTSAEAIAKELDLRIKKATEELSTVISNDKKNNEAIGKELDQRITKVTEEISELIIGTNKRIDETDEINKQLLEDRAEFKDLWKAQKLEARVIAKLRDPKNSGVVRALITQKGLDNDVSEHDLALLDVKQDDLMKALKDLPNDKRGGYTRLLANLAYAYVLMAVHYQTARDHVTSVIAEKTVKDFLIKESFELFKVMVKAAVSAAFQAGMAALTSGVSTVIAPELIKFVEDVQTGLEETPVLSDGVEHIGGRIDEMVPQGLKAVPLVATINELLTMGDLENKIQEPYDFFMEKEANLRKAVAFMAGSSGTDFEALGKIKVTLDRAYTIADLEEHPMWGFFFQVQPDADTLEKVWELVSDLLAVNMRRLCWRLFCRSQWKNARFDYTVAVKSPETIKKDIPGYAMDGPASEWHYKVWTPTFGAGMPQHWDKICNDFRGPEHDPGHPYTINGGQVKRAKKLLEHNAWCSMAAVQCCQIRRHDPERVGFGWDIDLEKLTHVGGKEGGEPQKVPRGWSDKILVHADLKDPKYANLTNPAKSDLAAFLKTIRVKGGVLVQISEISVGKPNVILGALRLPDFFKPTGKKGTKTSASPPDKPASALKTVTGMKLAVAISRTDSQGRETTSNDQAIVRVYKAEKEKHDGKNDCPRDENNRHRCFYCLYTLPDEKKKEEFKQTYRLTEVDAQGQIAWVPEKIFGISDGLNFINFPSVRSRHYMDEPGLYCVRLDPRTNLQSRKTDYLNQNFREQHISDAWWFKIDAKGSADKNMAPSVPKILKADLGSTEITGTYTSGERVPDNKESTLIHVYIGDKVYGPKKVKTPEPGKSVPWKIGVDPLWGGARIGAMATWSGTEIEEAMQSEEAYEVVLNAKPPVVNGPLLAGTTWVSGTSDAAEGVSIQLYIDDSRPDERENGLGLSPLAGSRNEDGQISWVIGVPPLEAGQRVKAAVWANDSPLQPSSKATEQLSVSTEEIKVEAGKPPDLNEPLAGMVRITGEATVAAGLQICVQMNDENIFWCGDFGGPEVSGDRSWEVGGTGTIAVQSAKNAFTAKTSMVDPNRTSLDRSLLPLVPGVRVKARVFFRQKDKLVWCSPASGEKVVGLLEVPVVNRFDKPQKLGETTITGTANIPENLVADCQIWVSVDGTFSKKPATTIGRPDKDGRIAWKYSDLKNHVKFPKGVTLKNALVSAQVYGKGGKLWRSAMVGDTNLLETVSTMVQSKALETSLMPAAVKFSEPATVVSIDVVP